MADFVRIIPSLLLKGERLVKGQCFDNYKDAGNCVTTSRVYNAQGADELLILDIAAEYPPSKRSLRILEKTAAECNVPITIGGGISSLDVAKIYMDVGADKVFVNLTRENCRGCIEQIASVFGEQSLMLGIDVWKDDNKYFLYDKNQKKTTREWLTSDLIASVSDLGVGEIRLMRVNSEGKRTGLDLDLFKLFVNSTDHPIILEGGAGNLKDLREAFEVGCKAVALGTMLVFSDNNIVKVKSYLDSCGVNVRPF